VFVQYYKPEYMIYVSSYKTELYKQMQQVWQALVMDGE